VVADFKMDGCGPCVAMEPVFERLSAEHSDVVFLTLHNKANAEICAQHGISAFPTFLFFLSGSKVDELKGADQQALASKIETLKQRAFSSFSGAGSTMGGSSAAVTADEARLARLKRFAGPQKFGAGNAGPTVSKSVSASASAGGASGAAVKSVEDEEARQLAEAMKLSQQVCSSCTQWSQIRSLK
jgi:thiol-disulfide isomerase/thioredoxin